MKKRSEWPTYLAGLGVFVFAFVIVVLTIPDKFEHYVDMGTSATGVAISRSYYQNLAKEFHDPPGFIYNGKYTVYNNWPPFGFMVLAQWQKLLGNDSIFNTRLFPSLLFAVSSLLFYLLLRRLGIHVDISVISAFLFTLLPHHLEFGKLVFSDMWLIPIWLISCHIFISKTSYQWLIIPVGLIGSIGFMWFSFFAIPAYIAFRSMKYSRLHIKHVALLVVIGAIGIRFALTLFSYLPDVYILNSLERWIQFSGFNPDNKLLFNVIKRTTSLIYESFPTLVLFLFLIKTKGIDGLWNELSMNEEMLRVLKFIILILFFYIVILPNWVIIHTYGVSFFSIVIGLVGALLLQVSKKVFEKGKTILIGVSMLACSLVLFNTYPYLTKGYQEAKPVKSIIQWLDDKKESQNGLQSCVFFNLGEEVKWPHAFEFGIKEETNSYIFSNDSLINLSHLSSYIEAGLNELNKNGFHNFDSTQATFITSKPDYLVGFNITDSLKLNGIYIYKLEL